MKKFAPSLGFIVLLLGFGILTTSPGISCAETIDFIQNIALDFGVGFDTLSSKTMKYPLVSSASKTLPGGHQSYTSEIKLVEDYFHLEKVFEVEADASIGTDLFSSSISAKFLRENSVDKYSLYYVVHVKVMNQDSILANDPQLKPEAKAALPKAGGLNNFHLSYGDMFVRGMTYGSEYFGVIKISTTSEKNREDLSLKMGVSTVGMNVGTEIDSKLLEISKTNRVEAKQIISGGKGETVATTWQELLQNARKLTQGGGPGTPIKLILSDYTLFPEYTALYNDNLFLPRRALIAELQRNFMEYFNSKATIDYVTSYPEQFRFNPATRANSIAKLKSQSVEIGKIMETIKAKRVLVGTGKDNSVTLAALGIRPAENYALGVRVPPRYKASLPGVNLSIPSQSAFPLPRVKGDSEMGGNKPHIDVAARLVVEDQGKMLRLYYSVNMKETGDSTRYNKEYGPVLLLDFRDPRSGIRIQSVSPSTGAINARAGEDDHKKHRYPETGGTASGILKSAQCISDTKGHDDNKLGCDQVDFQPVTVTFAHEEDYLKQAYTDQPVSEKIAFRSINKEKLKRGAVTKKPAGSFRGTVQ